MITEERVLGQSDFPRGSISDRVWSIEKMGALLPEALSATKQIDKGLILKALGEKVSWLAR